MRFVIRVSPDVPHFILIFVEGSPFARLIGTRHSRTTLDAEVTIALEQSATFSHADIIALRPASFHC